ncbi:MAG: SDR family oxidoreductase [Armatimonadota bacterium]|nr:SDR family oxidoreductase [Armatimonadota bacterium]
MRLAGACAVVTGGARGIGRAVAERFAREGSAVGLLDIDGDGAGAVAVAINAGGGRALGLHADVADSAQVQAAVEAIARDLGPPTVLVNNAGIGGFVAIGATDAETVWARVLAVNLGGAYLCARYVVPHMIRAGGGSIINIASTRALMSEPDGEPYAASKGGLLALTHALAVSLGRYGIRVNAISPGWIHTRDETLTPADHAQHPVGRVGRPEDVAAACLFLADQAASGFMTGQNLVLDGGMTVKMIYV